MKPDLNTRSVLHSSLLITILIAAMLLPALAIAWVCKWIYRSRR